MSNQPLGEEEIESRLEAAPALAVPVALQLVLALTSQRQGWTTWDFAWWIWLVPVPFETAFLVVEAWKWPHRRLEQFGIRREAGIMLAGLASAANAFLVIAVIASLISGHEKSGAQLLLKGITVWSTNVILFGLWFWLFDRGGPVRRRRPNPPSPDFQFPQMENPELAAPGWRPQFLDYMYVSFTNSIAFSPTDAMPLSRWAKMLMLFESAISVMVVLLVGARAVNIFK